MPDTAEKIFVLRGVLSFIRLSVTLRLHVDHPVAWQETYFFSWFRPCLCWIAAFTALLFSQLVCVPEIRSLKAEGLLRS